MLQCDDPALSTLQFNGVSEYFDDLVAQIDAPLLNDISIIFLHQLVFDTPQLLRFFSHTNGFKVHARADVRFGGDSVRISPYPSTETGSRREVILIIKCRDTDWQLLL